MSYLDTGIKNKCNGRAACVDICPYNCISMKIDSEGFCYPEINKEYCVNCGLCSNVDFQKF